MEKEQNAWKIIPQYNNGEFAGYGVKDGSGNYLKDEKGNRVVISDKDKKNWFYDVSEDNSPNGCTIQYKGRKWKVSESTLIQQMKPRGKAAERLEKMNKTGEWVYEDTTDNGIIDGEVVWEPKKTLGNSSKNITNKPQNSIASNPRQSGNSK